MNSKLRLITIPALVIFIAACSSAPSEPSTDAREPQEVSESSESTGAPRGNAQLGDGETSILTQLMLGTLMLESTDMAVDTTQARELAPLWKALRSLTTSDTAAQPEIEAVLDQIQEAMNAEQIETITTFEITPGDMQSIMEDLGIEFRRPEGLEGDEDGDFQFPPGGFQGGPGGGQGGQFGSPGGFQGQGGDFDPEAFATQRAERGGEEFGGRAGPFLFDPLIELLEERAGLEGA